MSTSEIIFAGFGGQGIQSMGKLLCYGAMLENKNVSWLPSYGPEMRGGTSNCSVIISDDDIGSPIVIKPDIVVVLNKPSLEKFEPYLKNNGLLIMNSDLIDVEPKRTDINIIKVPIAKLSSNLATNKYGNVIILGVLIKLTNIISISSEKAALDIYAKSDHISNNQLALKIGYDFI